MNEESIKLERAKSHPVGKKAAERGRTPVPIGYVGCSNEKEAELAVGKKCPNLRSAITTTEQGQY